MTAILWIVLCGAIVGMADVIPGVSGGTMAVVLGIYDKMISSIGNFFKDIKKNLKFLIPFVIGAGLAIIAFSKVITYLLTTFPMQVNFFFIGLILGSIPMIGGTALKKGVDGSKMIAFVAGLAIMIGMFIISPSDSNSIITDINFSTVMLFIVSGFIASVAMIIPGISGSMMFLIFGVYYTLMESISTFNMKVIIPIGVGILLGLVIGSKLIAICIEKFPEVTYCAILGLVVGSLFPLFRNAGFGFNLTGLISILMMIVGAAVAFLLGRSTKDPSLQQSN